jgi:hypothetical protein
VCGAAPIVFELARDVPQGGVFLALPALLAVRLRHSPELYSLPAGFHCLGSMFLLLAPMALARIPSPEQLRYVAAGGWGNLLGLDRIPEVRTLREKLKLLCAEAGRAARWNAALAQEWISQHQRKPHGLAFYVDGHVRVYYGELTKLPRRHVARERFYLRATMDYWVNALDGQPFFYVNKEVDHGLVQALRECRAPRRSSIAKAIARTCFWNCRRSGLRRSRAFIGSAPRWSLARRLNPLRPANCGLLR